jgi:hypothetical protein
MTNLSDDARQTAQTIVLRERGRIRRLAILTIGLWIVAALLIPSVYLPLGAKVKHYAEILETGAPKGTHLDTDRPDAVPAAPVPTMQQLPGEVADLRRQQWIMGQIIYHQWIIGAIILGLALAAGILASGSTVALAMTIRRVTLRQVSEQLGQISEQLRQIQRGAS